MDCLKLPKLWQWSVVGPLGYSSGRHAEKLGKAGVIDTEKLACFALGDVHAPKFSALISYVKHPKRQFGTWLFPACAPLMPKCHKDFV